MAQRAGAQRSGVSQNNRIIERHPIRTGYFWTTYDFAGTRDRQNIFSFPVGPSNEGFKHDGTVSMFSLPNGFLGYFLANASRRCHRQVAHQHPARSVARGPHGDQRHLVHGLPRPRHQAVARRDPPDGAR